MAHQAVRHCCPAAAGVLIVVINHHQALDDPNDQHVSELDKVMESVKQQFLELSSPATLRSKADGLKVRTSRAPIP
jgi:hypothetical protein